MIVVNASFNKVQAKAIREGQTVSILVFTRHESLMTRAFAKAINKYFFKKMKLSIKFMLLLAFCLLASNYFQLEYPLMSLLSTPSYSIERPYNIDLPTPLSYTNKIKIFINVTEKIQMFFTCENNRVEKTRVSSLGKGILIRTKAITVR